MAHTATLPTAALACLAAAVSLPAIATGAEEFAFRRLSSADGLSHNSVYSMIQDRTGFLWFGTVDGLNRYDGYQVVVHRYDPEVEGSLSGNVVYALLEDRDGHLWAGTDGGLDRYDPHLQTFVTYPLDPASPEGGKNPLVRDLHEDPAGTLWAATSTGLLRREGTSLARRPLPACPGDRASELDVWAVRSAPDGALWALAGEPAGPAFLYRLAPDGEQTVGGHSGSCHTLAPEWGLPHTLHLQPDGTLWLAGTEAAELDAASDRVLPPSTPPAPAWSYVEGPDESLWAATSDGIWQIPRNRPPRHVRPDPGNPSWLHNYTRELVWDHQGGLWAATYGGAFHWDPYAKRFRSFRHDPTDPSSLSSGAVSALEEAEGGRVWVGSFGAGIDLLDLDSGVVARHRHQPGAPESLCNDVVWALRRGPEGRLWVGTEEGLCSLDPATGRAWRHPLAASGPDEGAPLARVTGLAVSDDGRLWVAGTGGLFLFDPATGRGHRKPLMEGHANVSAIRRRRSGEGLWLGLYGPRLGLQRAPSRPIEAIEVATAHGVGLRGEEIWDLVEDRSGRLWLATGDGLWSYDPGGEPSFRRYGSGDGLPGSVVYSLLEDEDGRLWLGTNQGVVRFDPRTGAIRGYDLGDGIAGLEMNRRAALRLTSGEMLFGGTEGVTWFHPEAIRDDPRPPPVVLTAVEATGRRGSREVAHEGLELLRLPHHQATVTFEFAALSFVNPRRNRYAYRLEGLDTSWVEAGEQRHARYTNINPGRYRFQVLASNGDGLWNETGASLAVQVLPPWWGTWWFRSGLVLALVLGLVAAHRLRVARLLELERLRLRIARDLHDDLGSELSGLALTADLMMRRDDLEERARHQLEGMRRSARRTAETVRDLVWLIDPEHDTVGALSRRFRETAPRLLPGCQVELALESGGLEDRLALPGRRHLFLAFKEMVHNAARHARAKRVRIALGSTPERLVLEVRDDGVGFDPESARSGTGLASLRSRAHALGGELSVASRAGEGTTVTFAIPLARSRDGGGPS